jgi:hypothetical protein
MQPDKTAPSQVKQVTWKGLTDPNPISLQETGECFPSQRCNWNREHTRPACAPQNELNRSVLGNQNSFWGAEYFREIRQVRLRENRLDFVKATKGESELSSRWTLFAMFGMAGSGGELADSGSRI